MWSIIFNMWRPGLLLLIFCAWGLGQEVENASNATSLGESDAMGNFTLTSDLLDLFNLRRLYNRWPQILEENLIGNANCTTDFEEYFRGLEEQKIWALKMDDASGHYSSGYFDGNNYWMGSLTQCSNIIIEDIDRTIELENKQAIRKTGLLDDDGYDQNLKPLAMSFFENPSFRPGFFIIKSVLRGTIISQNPRKLYVGLCVPQSCSNEDVSNIFQRQLIRNVKVLGSRSPTTEQFHLFTDTTFLILAATLALVLILICIGTTLELIDYFIAKERSKASSKADLVGAPLGTMTNVQDHSQHLRNALEVNGIEAIAEQSPENNPNMIRKLFMAFSIIQNFKAIFNQHVGSDTVPCIHGLRTISMGWVILGHLSIIAFKYSQNLEFKRNVEKEFLFQTIMNGQYSVDTFFFISGFLISFLYFRTNAKGKLDKLTSGRSEITSGIFHFFGLIIFRFVRLTVPYLFVLGISSVTMKYFEQYSIFEPEFSDQDNCPKYWIRNVFYINTFFPVEQMCMVWSWYLANDTQFFIIGVIVLIFAIKHFKVAAVMLAGILITAWTTTTYIAYDNNFIPTTDEPLALFDKIYDKPWTRIGPYMIGMIVGWVLFKTNCKIQLKRHINVAGWALALLLGNYIIYGFYEQQVNRIVGALWTSLSHSLWAVYIAWIVIACSTGNGGFINKILSSPILYPLSRTTYCAYLLHPLIIRTIFLNSIAPVQLGIITMAIYFFGTCVVSYLLAFILSLTFEAPVVSLLRLLEGQNRERH